MHKCVYVCVYRVMLVVFNCGIWGETLIHIFFILQLHDAFSIVLSPSLKSSVSWLAEQRPFSQCCWALDSRVTSSTEPLMCSHSHMLEAFDFLPLVPGCSDCKDLLLPVWRGTTVAEQRGLFYFWIQAKSLWHSLIKLCIEVSNLFKVTVEKWWSML